MWGGFGEEWARGEGIKTLVGEVKVDRVRLPCQVSFLPFAISLNMNFQKLKAWLNA